MASPPAGNTKIFGAPVNSAIAVVIFLILGTTWLWQKGYSVEQAVLKSWRDAGFPPAVEFDAMPQHGHTETVSMAFVSIPEAIRQVTIAMIDARGH